MSAYVVTKAFLMKAIIGTASAWELEPNLVDTPCLVEALWHESRGQSFEENLFVATVVKKRSSVKRWPDSICKVIGDKNQFSYKWDGNSDRIVFKNPIDKRAFKKVVEASVLVSAGIVVETESYHYYNKDKVKVKPRWVRLGKEEVLGLGLVHTPVILPKKWW